MTANLAASIVRVLNSDRDTAGTGFVIGDEGLIATCANISEGTHLFVAFPRGEPRPARLVVTDEAHDLAILRVEGDLPPGAVPVRLGRSAIAR